MAKVIRITDRMRREVAGTPADLQSCRVCGDDVVCHDEIAIDPDGGIVACDRAPGWAAQRAEFIEQRAASYQARHRSC